MLHLTRKINEIIYIDGTKISIKILGINSNNVNIGIHAPDDISIVRSELYEKIVKQKNNEKHKRSILSIL